MKIHKKAVTILAFSVGASVFVSTAMADMALGSGYDQLKASAKTTAAKMEKGLSDYTIETLFTLKDNGQTLLQAADVKKIDNQGHATENQSTTQYSNGVVTSNYTYSDPNRTIWKNGTENKYYETDSSNDLGVNRRVFDNPFERNEAPEMEKIVDALVGNLKNDVQAESSPDGGRVYSGSLSEAQVPALVNAVSSFLFKQQFTNANRNPEGNAKLPNIDNDVFVKKISGTAAQDKAGLLENVTGDIVLSGKDTNGVQHDLALNFVFKLSDIGSTKVSMPDISSKTIEKVSKVGGFTEAFVGTYKNNMVMEKDGKFVKIGERTLEITSVQDGKVSGKYFETVKPGFEAEYPAPYSFTFTYDPGSDPLSLFTYTNPKGQQEKGQLNQSIDGKIYFNLNVEITGKNSYSANTGIKYFDSEFDRVFTD